ncbi:MAG: aminodeoxychorismate/anthranilate synthase component II [Actinobacteria bacterium]|nr:aminodeoxychorismate/anthranilate synthase component II [Actinomycetota bacterium]
MAVRLLVVDNYDSFTYNLVQAFEALGASCDVRRNDAAGPDDLAGVDGLVVSPGPGRPEDAGVSEDLIMEASRRGLPTLGVCLGHQAIGHAFGGEIVRAPNILHGKTSRISHKGGGVFDGVTQGFEATRYHSLVVDERSLPGSLEVTARTDDGVVMGLRHREAPLFGVQFHPESILTPEGPRLLENFLRLCGAGAKV